MRHHGRAKKPRILTINERWNGPKGWVSIHHSPRQGICILQWACRVRMPVCCSFRRSAAGDGIRKQQPMPRAHPPRRTKIVGAIPSFQIDPVPFQPRILVLPSSPMETGNVPQSFSVRSNCLPRGWAYPLYVSHS